MSQAKFNHYYELTKPGIIYGNAITTAAGFFLASRGHVNWLLLSLTLLGMSLVIASGCIFNNYFDRDIDALMPRTQNRALVRGLVSVQSAIGLATVLIILGVAVLWHYVNLTALAVAMLGFVVYVGIYTPLKRRTTWDAVIGSVAGAVPPVVGYTAVTNRIDLGAILLFVILCIWQIPHFYAIAIYRADDYAAASIPVLPLQKGVAVTVRHMFAYVIAFIVVSVLLSSYGYTDKVYLAIALLLGLAWLLMSVIGFRAAEPKRWARKMFFLSLIVLTVWSVAIAVGYKH